MFEIYNSLGQPLIQNYDNKQIVYDYRKVTNDFSSLPTVSDEAFTSVVPLKIGSESLKYIRVNPIEGGLYPSLETSLYSLPSSQKIDPPVTHDWFYNPGKHCFDGKLFDWRSTYYKVSVGGYAPSQTAQSLFQLFDADGKPILNVDDGVRLQNFQYLVGIPPTPENYNQFISKYSLGTYDTKWYLTGNNYVYYCKLREITLTSKDGYPLYVSRIACDGLGSGYNYNASYLNSIGWAARWNSTGTQVVIQIGMLASYGDQYPSINFWSNGYNLHNFYVGVSSFPGLIELAS